MAKPKCQKCGNEDLKNFNFTDRPYAHRRIEGFQDGVLLVSASYQTEYEGEYKDTYRLHCSCGNILFLPCEIEHVDD